MDCKQHDRKRADYICTTCNNAPICRDCKTGKHSNHTVRTPREVAVNIEKELTKLKINDTQVIADLESDRQYVPCLKEEQGKENKEIEKQINLQRGRIHEAVDRIANNLVSLYKSKMEQNCDILDKRANEMQQHIEITSKHISEVRAILEELDDVEVINKAGRLVVSRMLDFDDLEKATYKPGIINITKLEEMMGCSTCSLPENVPNITSKEAKRAQHCVNANIARTTVRASSVNQSSDFVGSVHVSQQRLEVKERATFQCSKNLLAKSYAFEIWPTTKRFSCINCTGKNKLKLFDKNGRIEKILKL
ncbi:uncharacterized protein LOC110455138 [Mizuhopecten yessoensis]|uniref:uncharacterized protein LOC110455138 n=1 Tax=Mizuhopecten yessoensis TaxID=6573 RepID=UPI000B457ACF|nr:uncharacterized protein LOC110455138 [Mizuhopecten yessoensis]